VYLAIRPSTVAQREVRTAATRWAWIQAFALEISGSKPGGRGVDRVDRDLRHGQPGVVFGLVVGLVQFEIGLDVFFVASLVLTLLGPWLEKVLAAALSAPPSVAEGRLEVARVRFGDEFAFFPRACRSFRSPERRSSGR
jgi:hypothetical protein